MLNVWIHTCIPVLVLALMFGFILPLFWASHHIYSPCWSTIWESVLLVPCTRTVFVAMTSTSCMEVVTDNCQNYPVGGVQVFLLPFPFLECFWFTVMASWVFWNSGLPHAWIETDHYWNFTSERFHVGMHMVVLDPWLLCVVRVLSLCCLWLV